jgi:TPR repeat protein
MNADPLFEQNRADAEKGSANAQAYLGYCYLEGIGVARDDVEAVRWLRKAAEQNHASAQCNLGFCYDTGQGVAKDKVEAVKWHRKAAEQGDAVAQRNLGICYEHGNGVRKEKAEAVKWFRKAAEQGNAAAQYNLGVCYSDGDVVAKHPDPVDVIVSWGLSTLGMGSVGKDAAEAVKWFRKAAEQGNADAQNKLGCCYEEGSGAKKDLAEAAKWYRKAAEQGNAYAQHNLGVCYKSGTGVPKNFVEAHKWHNLASAQGFGTAKTQRFWSEVFMTREQIAEAQRRASEFRPRKAPEAGASASGRDVVDSNPAASATGFLITEDGFLVTNEHVVRDASQIRLVTSTGSIPARVMKVDKPNDLALLKAEGRFSPLPIASSRAVKLGGTVATVGFPNIGLQGFAPKLARGEIASLSGVQDDARYFQISLPVQPGNSGGALVDERGNVVGVVSAKLNAGAALATSGALPENVNYAVKSSFLLSFLESVPDVSAKLKAPNTKDEKFEDVVKSAQDAAVLVLVY